MYRKRQKYNNTKIEIDGEKFDSKKEAARYLELKKSEDWGDIKDLVLQPRYLIAGGFTYKGKKERARYYVADFQYEENGSIIVEDVKSPITRANPVYRLKRHLFLLENGDMIDFREV